MIPPPQFARYHLPKAAAAADLSVEDGTIRMRKLIWPVILCLVCACADHTIGTAESAVADQLQARLQSTNFSGVFVVPGGMTHAGVRLLTTCGYVEAPGASSPVRFVAEQTVPYMFVAGQNASLRSLTPLIVAVEDPTERTATMRSANSSSEATVFEEAFWNKSCVDTKHPASYTGE